VRDWELMVHTADLGDGDQGHGESRSSWQDQQDMEKKHDEDVV